MCNSVYSVFRKVDSLSEEESAYYKKITKIQQGIEGKVTFFNTHFDPIRTMRKYQGIIVFSQITKFLHICWIELFYLHSY